MKKLLLMALVGVFALGACRSLHIGPKGEGEYVVAESLVPYDENNLSAMKKEGELAAQRAAVEKVAVNFSKPDQKWLDSLTPEEARAYMAEGQFAPGSMLPKVEAAVKFAESKSGRTALITLLEKAKDGIEGKTGTRVHQ